MTWASAPGAHALGLENVPAFKHVFIIVLENEDYASSWGPNSPATYLNSLVPNGAFATQYYGASHASADNYIAMTSGQTPTVLFQTDCENWSLCEGSQKARVDGGRSIVDQLEEVTPTALTWGAYMDGMSRSCQHPSANDVVDPYGIGYATRHDPFVYYPPIVEDQKRCDLHVVPYTELTPTLTSGAVPNYVFITPDTCHDGHDAVCANDPTTGGLKAADSWLSTNVPPILQFVNDPNNDAVLFITFDESGFDDFSGCTSARGTCASGSFGTGVDGGGRIGLLALSPLVHAGHTTDTPYDHASLLRTIEDGFGISEHLNNASSPLEHAMTDLFTS